MKVVRLKEILILGGILVLISCSNARLYKGQFSAQSTADINFCTTPAADVVTNLKYLFVIDQSNNNQQNTIYPSPSALPAATPYPDPFGGTDPNGSKRYPSLISFLQNSSASSNTFYSTFFFNTNPVVPFSTFVNGGAAEDTTGDSPWYTAGVQNTSAYMGAQLQNVYCPNGLPCNAPQGDGGFSDYIDTLNLVLNSIQQDIAYQQTLVAQGQPLVTSSYVIFFISSGFLPITPAEGFSQFISDANSVVQSIMALKSNQQFGQYINSVTFNTGFYTTINGATSWGAQQAEGLLQSMATTGQGTFVNFATGNIDYTKFSVPQQDESFILRDVFVHDASSVWWNGQLMLDSDGDGIPDEIELQWGSNPYAYDSDGNGIGDGVEYYLWGSPCGSIPAAQLGQSGLSCNSAGAVKSFLAIPGCQNPGTYPNVYGDTDLDYLNDCEEGLIGTSNTDFDSNQDWVPDQLEWLYNVPFLYGSNGLSSDPTNDGVNDYQKIKQLFPVSIPVSQVVGVNPLSYQLTQTSTNQVQTCYNMSVQNLATMSTSDVFRLYVMESQGAVGSLRHMRVLKNVTHMNGSNINISDGDLTP